MRKFGTISAIVTATLMFAFAVTVMAGVWQSTTTTTMNAGGIWQKSKTLDLKDARGQMNIVFGAYSSKAKVYAIWPNSGGHLVLLGSYSSAAKGRTKINITTPYRYIFVQYTTMPSAVGKLGHSASTDVFSW